MSRYFDADGNQVDEAEGMALFSDANNSVRQVGSTSKDGVTVSTVLLVIDHNFGSGPPLIFETMIFGGDHDEYQERYSTREQAEAGHLAACELAFGGGA